MNFTYPPVLFLLVVPAALLVWTWRREGRRLVLPFDHGRQTGGGVWRAVINIAECLPALVLAVVIVILAGPQQLSEPKTKRVLTNIEFCVDVSYSMTAAFGDGTRYDASMKAIDGFLDYRKGDAFGLTFFGNSVMHWVPLTSDTSALRCAPPFMKPDLVPSWFNGTEIAKALLACRQVLMGREEGDRMIVLITDGDSFDLSGGNDIEVARRLKAANINVYAIHIAETRVQDELVNITHLTGGEVFQPDDPEAMKTVFQRIDAMAKTRLEKSSAETMDNFFPYCLAGLSLLVLGVCTMFGVRYTPW